jgi:hypothetical protein
VERDGSETWRITLSNLALFAGPCFRRLGAATAMECERSDPTDPVRQGDIVAAHPGNPWSRFAVVLSADCDLAQGKTGPNFVYAPIVGHYTYLADVWLPSEAAKLVARGRELVDKKLARFDAKVSCRHIDNWSRDGGAANVAARLTEILGKRASDVSATALDGIIVVWDAVQGLTVLAQSVSTRQNPRSASPPSEISSGHSTIGRQHY